MTVGSITFTRNGVTLWVLAIAALVTYLGSVETPPTQWNYQHWIQFAAAASGWAIGKLQASPMPSTSEVTRGFRDNGAPIQESTPL